MTPSSFVLTTLVDALKLALFVLLVTIPFFANRFCEREDVRRQQRRTLDAWGRRGKRAAAAAAVVAGLILLGFCAYFDATLGALAMILITALAFAATGACQ